MKLDSSQEYLVSLDFSKFGNREISSGKPLAFHAIFIQVNETNNRRDGYERLNYDSFCFQTQCASLRITDCNQLLREASREAILRDDVCTAQCGFVLAATEASSRLQQFTTPTSFPGFVSHRNSLRSAPTPVSFNGFKLPDLSQFIG